MSFIPAIYLSAPQVISGTVDGTYSIPTTVNANYTRLTPQFTEGGTAQSYGRVALNSGSQIEIFNLVAPSFTAGFNVLVEEFLPLFFRQVFYRNTVDITDANASNSINTGLTLGPKAFVVSLGCSHTGASSSQLEQTARLTLSGSTVTATRTLGNGATNTLTCGFMVIDPK